MFPHPYGSCGHLRASAISDREFREASKGAFRFRRLLFRDQAPSFMTLNPVTDIGCAPYPPLPGQT